MTNKEAIEKLKELLECTYVDSFDDAENEAFDMAIKALEQQPCEDCISRAEALKAIEEEKRDWGNAGVEAIDGCLEAVGNLPSVTPQQTTWIPLNVEGNEPKEEGHYLLYFDYGYVIVFYYDGRNEELWADAIAYMPLPEPYRESEE